MLSLWLAESTVKSGIVRHGIFAGVCARQVVFETGAVGPDTASLDTHSESQIPDQMAFIMLVIIDTYTCISGTPGLHSNFLAWKIYHNNNALSEYIMIVV